MENILGIGINVTFSGIVIVFSMLVLLVLILILFGKVGQLLKREKNLPVQKHTLVKVGEEPATIQTAKTTVSNEPSPEIIAVIAAAVATMYEGSTVKPVIKSVRRAGVRPVWAAAGIAENTRPF